MTIKGEIYQCNICGNIVKVMQEGKGQLVCCGEPMMVQEKKYTRSE